MTIDSAELTIRITVPIDDAELARSLMLVVPTRYSLNEIEATHSFYLEIKSERSKDFEEVIKIAVSKIEEHLLSLSKVRILSCELWCVIFSTEYAGLVLTAPTMRSLGEKEIDLYLSVYSDSILCDGQ